MKVLRVLARIFGWLLTPLVALAASFLGATGSAALLADDADPRRALILSLAGAAIFAVVVAWLWLRLLRRHGLPAATQVANLCSAAPRAPRKTHA